MSLFFSGKILWVPYLDVCGHERVTFYQDVWCRGTDHELEKPVFLGLFSSGTPISGPLLKEKAKHFSAQLKAESTDRESFKASTGCLDKFKSLFTIKFCLLYFVSQLHYCLINIHIFDYPDYSFKSQRVRITEVRLYQVHGEDDPWQLGTEGRRRGNWEKPETDRKKPVFLSGKKTKCSKKETTKIRNEYQNRKDTKPIKKVPLL